MYNAELVDDHPNPWTNGQAVVYNLRPKKRDDEAAGSGRAV